MKTTRKQAVQDSERSVRHSGRKTEQAPNARAKTAKNKAKTSVRHENEGARLLAGLPGSMREKGHRIGCSASMVSDLCNGHKLPSPSLEDRIAVALGVPAGAWTTAPGGKVPTVASTSTTPATEPTDTRGRLVAQADRLRALLDTNLSASGRIQTERALGQALAGIAKLDGAGTSEASLVRHPAHQRVMRAIFGVLERHPLAAGEVRAELHTLLGDGDGSDLVGYRERHGDLVAAVEAANLALALASRAER